MTETLADPALYRSGSSGGGASRAIAAKVRIVAGARAARGAEHEGQRDTDRAQGAPHIRAIRSAGIIAKRAGEVQRPAPAGEGSGAASDSVAGDVSG